MSRSDHWDVAAYALGVLDQPDIERFEEHLATCWVCASELESMLPVVDLLADVDPNVLPTVEQSTSEGVVLDRMIATVARDRKRTRRNQFLSLAAGVVLLVMLTVGALFAGGQWMGKQPDVLAEPPPTRTGPTPTVPIPTGTQGAEPGIGGPDAPEGEKAAATDDSTGVHAELALVAKPYGTEVNFALTRLPGPRTCRLVVLRKSGTSEVVSTWTVPVVGYGTASQPQPLTLQATTSAPRADIASVQVQSVDKGVGTPLVTVRL
ncbi:RNA polymerase subunit sigma [Micromonospora zhanjiangensis]|uniref:RNA polymerase subunit sigma n=1 Tax=Micromonospora zhanjiangensis TaxID=1522057 RepID=A0ABV8KGY9_9ACTN